MKNLAPKKVNAIYWILLAIGAIIAFAGVSSEQKLLFAAGIVIMYGSIVFRWICFRCPHCGKYLD